MLGKAAKEAEQQEDATEAVLQALKDQQRQVELRPNGDAMQKAIRDRVEKFLATDRQDPAERVRFNAWLNTQGLSVYIYRDQEGHTILDTTIEDAIGLTPGAGMYHYNIKLDTAFTGTLQHLVNNKAAGLITDMTTACPLNN
jgi:hypothetical protein